MYPPPLMRKPKIQPLIPFITRRRQIAQLFLFIHGTPDPIPIAIALHIIQLSSQIQEDVQHKDREEDVVSTFIARSVVFLVDICGDDSRCLHTHVVQSCGHGSRADSVGVATVPAYLDWVR